MKDETENRRDAAVIDKAIRDAATLLVVRDGRAGLEVLMIQRPERGGDLYSGACVFPGGVVEQGDGRAYALCDGLDDRSASAILGVKEHGLAYFVAAIRECFEEAGLLFCYGTDGKLPDADDQAKLRRALRQEAEFGQACTTLRLRIAVDRLAYHSHWLTPPGLPKRFDTRFFLAMAPATQIALHDGDEAVRHFWLPPAEALARASELKLRPATIGTLKSLAPFASAAACHRHAMEIRDIEVMMPRRARASDGPRTLLPGDPAYAEVARIDPDGRGHASCEIGHEHAVRLSEHVIRLSAPNGNAMTGPGTNSYLVGGGRTNEWAVIDPGPDIPDHVDRILAAAPGPIRFILVTHTHRDHSAAADRLQSATGAHLLGWRPLSEDWPNCAFRPDRSPADGERLSVGEFVTLKVIHTPGHASNHLCYLLEEEKTLFTGDHLMQGSSVVITPPDGDMEAYLASLNALLQENVDWLAPGHGHLMDEPRKVIRKAINHRRMREAKIVRAIEELAPVGIDALLTRVYDDVPERMHPMAKRSLWAHILKLSRGGVVVECDGHWRLCSVAR